MSVDSITIKDVHLTYPSLKAPAALRVTALHVEVQQNQLPQVGLLHMRACSLLSAYTA